MVRTVTAAAALLLLAPGLQAEVEVQYRGGRVHVRATAAPLSQVLDRLGRATGMKVVYQGAAPSVLVSLSLEDRTPAEAVFGVLEGLGLNYAFVLDAAGSKVETLMLAGAAGSRPASSTATPPAAAAPAPRFTPRPRPGAIPPAAGPDPSEDEGEEAIEEPESDEPEEPEDAAEAEEQPQAPAAPTGPRGSVLQPPSQPVYPSSPFAPRAPMFVPQPDPQPTPTPKPPD
jgi:hypothetical protein